MLITLLNKLLVISRRSTWYGRWLAVRSWWILGDKTPLLFLSLLVLLPTIISLLIYQALESHKINRELLCLTLNIYHEARGEPRRGQYAVAEVTMNRVESDRFPNTVCDVVYEKRWDKIRKRYVSAFSWTEIDTRSRINQNIIQHAWQIAETVYHGRHQPLVKDALFYHARYVRPSWARKKSPVARIGQHVFYR